MYMHSYTLAYTDNENARVCCVCGEQARVPPAQKPWPFSPPIIRPDHFSPVTRFVPTLFAPRPLSPRVFAPKFRPHQSGKRCKVTFYWTLSSQEI